MQWRRRHLYVLLWAIPTLLASLIGAAVVLAAAAGALWLFVLGDNPWPTAAEVALTGTFVLVLLVLWGTLLAAAWAVGRQQESAPRLNAAHVAAAAGVTVLLGAFVALRVAGPMGPKSDGEICSDMCQAQGFSASGMPPTNTGDRTCTCYGEKGAEREFPLPSAPPR
jgi:hypothetical protein